MLFLKNRDNALYDQYRRITNANSDQIYQYINQQTTCTFRTHEQHRSWTLPNRHRQMVHSQPSTRHTVHQSKAKETLSMEMLQRNQQWIWNTRNQPEMAIKELKLNSKWPSPYTYRKDMQIQYYHGAQHLNTLEQYYGSLIQEEASRKLIEEFGRTLEIGKKRKRDN